MRLHEKAFETIQNGIYVITTKDEETLNGMTAAWVSRVSFEPPLLMVAIGHGRYTHSLINNSGIFAVNVLAEGQVDLGKHFGFKTGRKTDKLKEVKYIQGETGAPILEGVAAYMDCRLRSTCEAGDHTLFVGEVIVSEVYDKNPLLFRHEDFF